jgi:hypothetical protein
MLRPAIVPLPAASSLKRGCRRPASWSGGGSGHRHGADTDIPPHCLMPSLRRSSACFAFNHRIPVHRKTWRTLQPRNPFAFAS